MDIFLRDISMTTPGLHAAGGLHPRDHQLVLALPRQDVARLGRRTRVAALQRALVAPPGVPQLDILGRLDRRSSTRRAHAPLDDREPGLHGQ